ncbi:MAG: hypothetical protein CNB76_02795 [Puniceicoccaceae bacterium MED-G32]|nr:MAG: hypothetical protein CNB76_02795 [Puniceicoccaceae bacterium MED-G32]
MNLNKRITRKSFFKKLGLFSGGSVVAGYYTNKGFTSKSSAMTSRLDMRFKKPSNIIQSDILS